MTLLDDDLLTRLRPLIGRLARQVAASRRIEYEDAAQELILRLLIALPKQQRSRGSRGGFATTVLRTAAAMLHRELRTRKRQWPAGSDSVALQHLVCPASDLARNRHDLALDLPALLEQVPEPLRELARALREMPVAGAARQRGFSRAGAYRHLATIRQHLELAGWSRP